MSATSASAVVGRRACAVLAASSAVLHGVMVGDAGSAVAVLIVAMTVACLYCARELWTAGSPRVWCIVAVMNLAMVAVHWSMPGHHHGQVAAGISVGDASPMSTLMVVATTISVVEATIATAVLWIQTRRRAITLAPQWN